MKNAWKKLSKSNRKATTTTTTSLPLVASSNTGTPNINAQITNTEADILISATHSPFNVDQTSGPDELSGNSAVSPITSSQMNFMTIVMSSNVQDSIHSSEPISRNPSPTPASHDPDTSRSLERYREEVLRLKLALQNRRNEWGSFDFPELDSIPENEDITILQIEVEKVLDAKKKSLADKTA